MKLPANAQRIAFASTESMGFDRWTELAVYHIARPGDGKAWLATSTGKSVREGETDRENFLHTFGLDSALELFEDNAIGRAVKAEARDWRDHHEFAKDNAAGHPVAAEKVAFDSDDDALAYLFPEGMSNRQIAAALGLGESSLRMARKDGGAGVKVPLMRIAHFIDAKAFRAAMSEGADG